MHCVCGPRVTWSEDVLCSTMTRLAQPRHDSSDTIQICPAPIPTMPTEKSGSIALNQNVQSKEFFIRLGITLEPVQK